MMLDKLKLVEERYMEAAERMAQPEFFADPKAAAKLMKEQNLCLEEYLELEVPKGYTGIRDPFEDPAN